MTEYKSKLNFFTAGKTRTLHFITVLFVYFNVVNNLISEEVFRTDYNKLLLKGNIIWSRVRSTHFFGKTTSHGPVNCISGDSVIATYLCMHYIDNKVN